MAPGLAAEAAVPAVLASPAMTRLLLSELSSAIKAGHCDGPDYNPVIAALFEAHNSAVARVISKNQPV